MTLSLTHRMTLPFGSDFLHKVSVFTGNKPEFALQNSIHFFPLLHTQQKYNVAKAAMDLRNGRNKLTEANKMTLSDIYRLVNKPGHNIIKDLHAALDQAALSAYGFSKKADILQQLLALNLLLAEKESNNETVQKPGIPEFYQDHGLLISRDCVKFSRLFAE